MFSNLIKTVFFYAPVIYSIYIFTDKINDFNIFHLLSYILVLFLIFRGLIRNKIHKESIFFISGLLFYPLEKFFLWTESDLSLRMDNLMLISFIFTLLLFIHNTGKSKTFVRAFYRLNSVKRSLMIFFISAMIFTGASALLIDNDILMSGDEPHYVAIAQSIARDYDLNVFNQYARGKYREFIDVHLPAHSKPGKGHKKWYSFHLPGLSFTIAPFLFFKIDPILLNFLIRSWLGLFGALGAVLVHLLSMKIFKKRFLSFFLTILFMLTSPVFFSTIHIYAEVQALVMILAALYLFFYSDSSNKIIRVVLPGFFIGAVVFWGIKYVLFAVFFFPVMALFLYKQKRYRDILLLLIFPALFAALFLFYLYSFYGTFSPMAVYNGIMTKAQKEAYYKALGTVPQHMRVDTLFDYFFDQRDGLLPYNPVYFLFFPGIVIAFKKFRKYRYILSATLPGFIYLLYHAYSTVRPGFCPQARYLVPIIWLFILFTGIYLSESENSYFKSFFLNLSLFSIFITVSQLLSPATLYQPTTHNVSFRSGLLFMKFSNTYFSLDSVLPSFLKTADFSNYKYSPNIIWALLFILVFTVSLLSGRKRRGIGRGTFRTAFLIFILVFAFFPRIPVKGSARVTVQPSKRAVRLSQSSEVMGRGKFRALPNGRSLVVFSSKTKINNLHFRLKNTEKRGFDFSLVQFDTLIDNKKFKPEDTRVYKLDKLQYKKFRNEFHYVFEINHSSEKPLYLFFF